MKNENAEYVQKLRVNSIATKHEIQEALHQLFKSSPQGRIQLTNEDTGPQGNFLQETRPSVIGAAAISKIQ